MRVLCFDIWADFGHFKRYYTTASPLSFSIPPVTAVYGILGAICGFSKEEYIEKMKESKTRIAIRIKRPIRKVRFGINWIETKSAGPMLNRIKERTQIKIEYLRNPEYRIFVTSEDWFIDDLKKFLFSHKCVYTVSMGISECIANFCFIDEMNGKEQKDNGYINISSVAPFSAISSASGSIKFEEGKKYSKERLPILMSEDRQVIKYDDILFEVNGKSIQCKVNRYIELNNGENIVFMP